MHERRMSAPRALLCVCCASQSTRKETAYVSAWDRVGIKTKKPSIIAWLFIIYLRVTCSPVCSLLSSLSIFCLSTHKKNRQPSFPSANVELCCNAHALQFLNMYCLSENFQKKTIIPCVTRKKAVTLTRFCEKCLLILLTT